MTHQTDPSPPARRWLKPLAGFAILFGAMTLFSGGSVLFGPAASHTWAGNYIGFVVWFNFGAGAAYIVAGIGLLRGKPWAARLAALIAIATAIVAAGFAIVVMRGTPFEMRTVGALGVRFAFWAITASLAKRALRP